MIAQKKNLDKNYIAHVSEKDVRVLYPSTIGKHIIAPNYIGHQSVQILVEQKKLIEELAAQGDCVIVGRCADLILKEHYPLNVFVYADQESKVARCLERSDESEKLSPDQLVRKMKEIDRNRASHRAMFADSRWGSKENYHRQHRDRGIVHFLWQTDLQSVRCGCRNTEIHAVLSAAICVGICRGRTEHDDLGVSVLHRAFRLCDLAQHLPCAGL